MGIQSNWTAYQFDMAVLTVGLDAEKEQTAVISDAPKGKDGKFSRDPADYQSPIGLARLSRKGVRRMKLPESGTW